MFLVRDGCSFVLHLGKRWQETLLPDPTVDFDLRDEDRREMIFPKLPVGHRRSVSTQDPQIHRTDAGDLSFFSVQSVSRRTK